MDTDEGETFEQKGDDVVASAAKLGELSSDLSEANSEAQEAPEEVGSWITAIGRSVLAIFGVAQGGGS